MVHTYHGGILHGLGIHGIMTHGTGIHGTTPDGTALGAGTMQGIMTLGTTDIMEDGMGIIMDITMLGGKVILAESPEQDKIWATAEAGAHEMLSQGAQEVT